ncbi:MAG: hypothetical protein KBS60_04280 [Phascolarctobacterium sp.]|nr:hypothetical protein [Candidatus Phascolarctobacterium caballi]
MKKKNLLVKSIIPVVAAGMVAFTNSAFAADPLSGLTPAEREMVTRAYTETAGPQLNRSVSFLAMRDFDKFDLD